jgi:peptidyl-tRNA hydrolase, PTH1 family
MFLITGLGNPGRQYENTPHNAGFLFLDILREKLLNVPFLQVSEWENEEKLFASHLCKVRFAGSIEGVLQKPMTYMNNSGVAVNSVYKKFDVQKFVLVHDDLDIALGSYKIQEGKSPKGHNGVLSVENSLQTTEFTRVRLGIENRDGRQVPGEEYVLQRYSKEELETLSHAIEDSISELKSTLAL